jgi:hypothetical protein
LAVRTITTQIELSSQEEALLCDVFDCDAQHLDAQIARFGVAAIREYLEMFMGTAPITTATDLRERRLVGLMLTAFQAASPGAEQIARLFNITPSAARSLLKSVNGKYRIKLKTQTDAALKAILDACQRQGNAGPYSVVITNPVLLGLMNDLLEVAADPKTPIRRTGDSLTRYTVDEGTFSYLRAIYP